jgi:hypothetical protein
MVVPWQSTPSPEIQGLSDTVLARRVQDRGDVLRVVDAEDLHARIVPEVPGREGDRGQVQLQMAQRQANDRLPDMALVHRAQLCGDAPVMPARREW